MQDPKKSPKIGHLGTIAQLCRAISSQLRHLSTIGKKLVKQQYLLHMSPQYGELWPTNGYDRLAGLGTPSYFNGYRVLAALLHGTLLVGVSQTLRRWTEGVTYIRQGDHRVGHWPTFLVVYWYECNKRRKKQEVMRPFVDYRSCVLCFRHCRVMVRLRSNRCVFDSRSRSYTVRSMGSRTSQLLPLPRRICNRRCLSVCFSVINFSQKLPNGFAQNFPATVTTHWTIKNVTFYFWL